MTNVFVVVLEDSLADTKDIDSVYTNAELAEQRASELNDTSMAFSAFVVEQEVVDV